MWIFDYVTHSRSRDNLKKAYISAIKKVMVSKTDRVLIGGDSAHKRLSCHQILVTSISTWKNVQKVVNFSISAKY